VFSLSSSPIKSSTLDPVLTFLLCEFDDLLSAAVCDMCGKHVAGSRSILGLTAAHLIRPALWFLTVLEHD